MLKLGCGGAQISLEDSSAQVVRGRVLSYQGSPSIEWLAVEYFEEQQIKVLYKT